MSILPHRVGLEGFKDFSVLKLEIRFTLGLNAAEITDYMKKSFK